MNQGPGADEPDRLKTLMFRYGESHQNRMNKRIHLVCVPVIMLSTLGMAATVPTWPDSPINFAHVLVLIASIYYLQFRNFPLLLAIWSLCAVDFLIISTFGNHRFAISFGFFVISWIGQFIGHKVEGKKPSFFEDIFFLLVGPLWVLYALAPRLFSKPELR